MAVSHLQVCMHIKRPAFCLAAVSRLTSEVEREIQCIRHGRVVSDLLLNMSAV